MQYSRSSTFRAPARRLVLGAAFALGLVVALIPHTELVLAAGPVSTLIVAQADTARNATPGGAAAPGNAGENGKATAAPPAASTIVAPPASAPAAARATPPASRSADEVEDADSDETGDDPKASSGGVGNHGIVIHKGSKRIRVEGLRHDREYDSFEQFVQDAPWLAGLVFVTVLLGFLIPLLIIVLLIWYKIRKNRMANETMLKLAERGVVPPALAMDAVASGNAASVAAAAASASAPAYEHARSLHRRTVWSDLRKGVILTGVGVGLSAFSMFDDGTANSVGLVALFVGLGYCLLWFFEDRTAESRRGRSGTPPPGSA